MNLPKLWRKSREKSASINSIKKLQPSFKSSSTALCFGLLLFGACTQEREAQQATAASQPAETAVAKETAPQVIPTSLEVEDTTKVMVDSTASAVKAKPTYPGPAPLPGAVLPEKRILAYYGNPLSKRMGILGEFPEDVMLQKLDAEIENWRKADPETPIQPALHVIVVTAQGQPGKGNKYRLRMTDKMIDGVLEMAAKRDAIVFLDVQVGQSTLQEELPQLEKYLKMPQVHLGVDAEFSMKNGGVPGRKIGSFDAEDLNYASGYLAKLVQENQLPPKVFVVHRFTQRMITNYQNIKLRPEVQVVMHMDGWGAPFLKKDTYRAYIKKEPVQFTGFKIFYKNDTKKGNRLMTPAEVLALEPTPMYIQYQ